MEDRDREGVKVVFELLHSVQVSSYSLWNYRDPVKRSTFSNYGVMLVLERREIIERIKLQNPTSFEELHPPLFGPILLHISVSSTLL